MSDGQTFRGVKEGGIVNFRGIPFAEPPVGNLRWKAPRLKTFYPNPVDATSFGYNCATLQTVDDPQVQDQSEDCLHLNIQVAEWVLKNKRKLPAVAYIHGGAFGFGNNRDDLTSLVSQGLVSFNINYRLGPYGFLHLPETEVGEKFRGNWGLLDQRAALEWISIYGGVFGADKDSIVLDGCSAGSQSTWHHITSQHSWPYFHRAVTTGIGMSSGIYYEGEKTDVSLRVIIQ